MPTSDELQALLDDAAKRHNVPGASAAVFHDGEVTAVATGVLNKRTGVEATTDSLFQIGSITKTWTATMVMQLVEEGKVDLDTPLKTYLPDWKVADPDVTAHVTIRHLLTHSSGIDGDHFEDTGRGDDCLEKYAASCATVGQTHGLGETMSYCNTGFSLLGRLLEVMDGQVWDHVLRHRLIGPLVLNLTNTLPEEALLYRAAVGHMSLPGVDPFPAPMWMLQRSAGPAGLINASAEDVVRFAAMHIAGGTGRGPKRILSEESVAAMQQPQVEVPDPFTLGGNQWGLGWHLPEWGDRPMYGHDGGTLGQHAYLRVVPDANLAVSVLTNGGSTGLLYREVMDAVVGELAGMTVPPVPEPPAGGVDTDLTRFVGTYERLSLRIAVEAGDDACALKVTVTSTGSLAEAMKQPPYELMITPCNADGVFVATGPMLPQPMPAVFYRFGDNGRPGYLHFGARAQPRVSA